MNIEISIIDFIFIFLMMIFGIMSGDGIKTGLAKLFN